MTRVSVFGIILEIVYFEVAAHQDEEGDAVDKHEEYDVALAERAGHVKRETDGKLAVIRDADQREDGHDEGEEPAERHDVGRVAQRQPLIQMHGVRDGVVALHRDDGQREHRQLRAEDAEEAGHLAAGRKLPRDGVHAELAQRRRIHHGQETQVDAHEEVGHPQITHLFHTFISFIIPFPKLKASLTISIRRQSNDIVSSWKWNNLTVQRVLIIIVDTPGNDGLTLHHISEPQPSCNISYCRKREYDAISWIIITTITSMCIHSRQIFTADMSLISRLD